MGSSAPANWHLQKSNRKGGLYYQAALRVGKERRVVTLGYLAEDVATDIEAALQEGGLALTKLSNEQIKAWALEPASRAQLLDIGLSPQALARMTLRQFVDDEYREWRKSEVSSGTWRTEGPRLDRLVSDLGHVRLTNLTAHRWERYRMSREVSPRTKKLEENAYKEVLKRAHHLGAIPSIHAFSTIRGATKRTRSIEPLSPDEVQLLLDNAPSAMHRALFALAVGVGLRPQEVVRVRWEDMDWENSSLLVRGTKNERSEAPIPVTFFAMHEMDVWRHACGDPETGLAFTWGNSPIRSFKKALKTAAVRAGLDRGGTRRIFPNLLRHSFATMAASSGVPIIVAQQIMRHSTSKMLLDVYARAGAQQLREGLDNFPLK